jgi:hypothetical protein
VLRRVAFSLLIVALTSCATSKLAPEKKASLRNIHVAVEFLREPFVYGPEGNALQVTSGKAPDAPRDAAAQYAQLLARHLDVGKLIQEQAQRELVRKGYRIAADPGQADARLRFMVVYGLGVASAFNNARAVSTTVNMELVRASDSKRLVFAIAAVVKDDEKKALIRAAPYEQWFTDENLLVSQHRLIAETLTLQAMEGL